jgi:DNA-binding NtrC family response regulator
MKGGPIILIGEPTDLLHSELAAFFLAKGLQAVRARTLKETLLALQSRRVDALVLDAALLEEDCGFLSIIKGMDEHLPIILCAEVNTPEFEGKVRQQRIFFYHIKSFGTQDLEMAISNAVQKSLQHHSGGSRHGAAEQD